MKYQSKFETMTSYRMKKKTTNQERALMGTSNGFYECPISHTIVTHETLTELAMESSPAYQLKEEIITTSNSVGRVAPDTLSVIYDNIDINRESADMVTEAISASLVTRNEVIPTHNTPGQIPFDAPNVTYDYIDEPEISHDIGLEGCPAYESHSRL